MTIELGELRSKGLQIVRGVFTGAAADDLRARAQAIIDGVADGRFSRNGQFAAGMSRDWADAIVRGPEVLDMVQAALGPDLCLFDWRILMKDHHFNGPIETHQDWPYYGGGSAYKINAFIPLTKVGRSNGGLVFTEGRTSTASWSGARSTPRPSRNCRRPCRNSRSGTSFWPTC